MEHDLIYLDTYVLQQDMRIRLPKSVLTNMGVEKGVSKFDIYFDPDTNNLVLRVNCASEDETARNK